MANVETGMVYYLDGNYYLAGRPRDRLRDATSTFTLTRLTTGEMLQIRGHQWLSVDNPALFPELRALLCYGKPLVELP